MIQPLRRAHWRWMVALAAILPLLLALILFRRDPEAYPIQPDPLARREVMAAPSREEP